MKEVEIHVRAHILKNINAVLLDDKERFVLADDGVFISVSAFGSFNAAK